MNKMFRNKIIGFLVSLLLVLSIIPSAVLAETHQILIDQEPTFDNFSEKIGQRLYDIRPKLTVTNDNQIEISAAPTFEKFDGTNWQTMDMEGALMPGTWRLVSSVFYLHDNENHHGLSMESEVIVNGVKWNNLEFTHNEAPVYGKVPRLMFASPAFEVVGKANQAPYIVRITQEYCGKDDYVRVYGKVGNIGEMTDVACDEIEGYACEVKNKNIEADGSTVVEVNYNLNKYKLTWDFDGGTVDSEYYEGEVDFGCRIDDAYPTKNPTKEGYEFVGWSEDLTSMPARNVTIKALFDKITLINRIDLHFLQNFERLEEKAGAPSFKPLFEVVSPSIVQCFNHMNIFYYEDPVTHEYLNYEEPYFKPGNYSAGVYLRVEGEESRLHHCAEKVDLYVDGVYWGKVKFSKYNYGGLYQFGWGSSDDFTMREPDDGVLNGLYYIHHVQEVEHEYDSIHDKYFEKEREIVDGVVGQPTLATNKTYQGFHAMDKPEDVQKIVSGNDYQNIYLHYDRDRINLRFDSYGADSGAMDDLEIIHGVYQKLPKCAFTKDGYVFDGWTTEPDGGTYFNDEDEVKVLQFTIKGAEHGDTVRLYANWAKVKNEVNAINASIKRPVIGKAANYVNVGVPLTEPYKALGNAPVAWGEAPLGSAYNEAVPMGKAFEAGKSYWASVKFDLTDPANDTFTNPVDVSNFVGADKIEKVNYAKDGSYVEVVCRFDLSAYEVPGLEEIKNIEFSLNYPVATNRQDEIKIKIADDKEYRVVGDKFNMWLKGDDLNTAVPTTEDFAEGNTYWGIFKLELKDPGANIFAKKISVFVGGADEVAEAYVVNDGQNVNITLRFTLKPTHVHNYTKVSGKAPTCTEDGHRDYYECDCGLYFEAEGALTPIPDLDVWKKGNGKLDALGHDIVKVPEVKATETTAGTKEYYHCNRCGKNFKDENLTEEIIDLDAYLPIPPISPEKPDPEKPGPEKPDPEKPNPEKPDPQPEKPETDDVPKTSDISNISLYASISLFALVTLITVIEEKKRYMNH